MRLSDEEIETQRGYITLQEHTVVVSIMTKIQIQVFSDPRAYSLSHYE